MVDQEPADQVRDASWVATLAALGLSVGAIALMLLPALALAGRPSRPWIVAFGLVAFVVARAKVLTMLWAVASYVHESSRRRQVKIAVYGNARLSFAAVTVVFALAVIPHC